MEGSPEKSTFGIKCMRFMLSAINVIYLIVACLMIVGATTLKVVFGEYYFTMWYSTLHSLPSLWIATGCFLAIVSIFGIFSTFKKSTMLLNLYAFFLSLVFVLQMAAAIVGFTLLPQTREIVRSSIHSLMSHYMHIYKYRLTMDWIQQRFECCGNDGPSNWHSFSFLEGTIPQSCCTDYTYFNGSTCDRYHSNGCHSVLHDIVFNNVLLIGSSAMVIGLLQVLGVICACILAGWIRRSKTNRAIQRWTGTQNLTFEQPAALITKQEEKIEDDRVDINYI